jgi:hypothetical protein
VSGQEGDEDIDRVVSLEAIEGKEPVRLDRK